MITLYGSARSSAGRCVWALEEAGIPYELKNVDFKTKENKSETFLKINPNGKVPAMVDGSLNLFESMAINNYIAEKYKPELLGTTIEERAISAQWSFWSTSELQDPIIQVFIQKVFVPEDKRSQAVIDENMAKLPGLLSILDKSLAGKTYLNGKTFTLADLNTQSVVGIAPMIGFDISPYKNVDLWLKAITDRPAFQKYMSLRQG
jgi:glutathione S-transferase